MKLEELDWSVFIYWMGRGGGGLYGPQPQILKWLKNLWIFNSQASYLNETEQISVQMNMSKI